MGSGREGFPLPSPTGEGKGDQRARRRKSGGGITVSMYHHMIGKEQVLGLQENNGCKSNGNHRPIDHNLSNAAALRVSTANSLSTHKKLSSKSIGQFDTKLQNGEEGGGLAGSVTHKNFNSKSISQYGTKQQHGEEGGGLAGSVSGRRKNRLNLGDEREISPLNYQRPKVNQEEGILIGEELDSPSSICKVNAPKRKNSRTEVTEGIALQQSVDQQPNSRLASRSGRSSRNSRVGTVETGGCDLGHLDTAKRTKQLSPCRPHKRKTPEPNAGGIPQDDNPVKPCTLPPILHFDPKPIYPINVLPVAQIDPEPVYCHNVSPIPNFDSDVMYTHDLPPIPQLHSESSSRHSNPSIPSSAPELQLTDLEPNVSPIHHLCLEATDHNTKLPVSYPSPLEAGPLHSMAFGKNVVQAPEPTKSSPCLPRRTRRSQCEEPERLHFQYMDLIMWTDAPKSALLFGFGSFCVLSSSFTQDLQFSLVTFVSYLALAYLAAVFLYKTILRRGTVEQENSLTDVELISEADALWVLRSALPVINLSLAKFQKLFSGDPATTMKLASVLWLLAKCGHTMTIWNLAKLSFFAIFTIPKLYTRYSAQLNGYGLSMLLRFRDAWNTCSHKKGVLVAVFLFLWNYSTVTARLWGAFILIVALRLYHQSFKTYLENQQSDPSEENIQIEEIQAVEVSKLELMKIPQEVF
ncbi:uncharacterized protein LOC131072603 isoform X2 [Cryptomeria japonica]|uniref:uncharacterized protein LOC131072603 isoform X2 n=1 Tax=Cryptomeria japonica TaxID=3369 RepID=UPI0025ABC195|nr:uncharacterized protein LOC131072603 isoform X2 [Cryptomeria japonica]